ncbi:MAG: extracellular solute-binding protein [Planctomycetota bacterium]|nr:MAG: extracellular solute-binding protein [Planctomycetota bacterium]
MIGRVIIALLLAIILGVPFLMTAGARDRHDAAGDGPKLIIITPHVPQIRDEFARAFAAWHQREYGQSVEIDWRTPGGTSEIRKQLDAVFQAAVKRLAAEGTLTPDASDAVLLPAGSIDYDLFFGGGSYDHSQVANPMRISARDPAGQPIELRVRQSAPMDLTESELVEIYGPNRIGPQELYDPAQRWLGTALSSFGIVYNREVLARLGIPEPDSFKDLGDPRLIGWVALADPRQSGSVTTTFDSILGNQGWDDGWRTLRAMCGTTRYFTNSSTKPPIDVSLGEAAAGLAIDFYGRGQAQVIAETGGGDRVGYADPAGSVYVDADPISLINGAPNPELAKRFIRFCLTEEAQALWQFRAGDQTNPTGPDGQPMGPREHELRRMPVRRVMYDLYFDAFVDQVNPFEIVSDIANPGWRTGVQMMMGCFGVDLADECRAAYAALERARTSGKFTPAEIEALEARFFAFPRTRIQSLSLLADQVNASENARAMIAEHGWRWTTEVRNWSEQPAMTAESAAAAAEVSALADLEITLPFTEATYAAIRNEWRQPGREARLKIEYTQFFRDNYRAIVREVESR